MPLQYSEREIRDHMGKSGKRGLWESCGSRVRTKHGVCPGCSRGEQGIPCRSVQQAQAAAGFPRQTTAVNCSNKWKVRSRKRGGLVLNSLGWKSSCWELQWPVCPHEGSASPSCPLPPEAVLVYKWSGWCWLSVCLLSHPPRNVPPECPGSSYFRRKPLFFFHWG